MNWLEDKNIIVSTYFNCLDKSNQKLFLILKENRERSKDIYPLVRYIADRVATVWFLTLNDKLWDADIIDRSVLENLVKLLFIVNSPTKVEQENRIDEFWNKLWEISSLKHSQHSREMVEQFKEKSAQLAHKAIILSEEQEEKLKIKWNRKDRKKLAQKWSFSEIVKDLIKNYDGQYFEMLTGLFHEYRMCSHIAHGDETGIGIIEERKSRNQKEREIVHRGHFLKLISNCLAYTSWTAITCMKFLGKDKKQFFDIHNEIEKIKHLEKIYHEEVFNDPDYDKFKSKQV